MNAVSVIQGAGPIILAQPHSGTFIPDPIALQLNDLGRELLDTDWHVPMLYDGLIDDVTVVRANFSRYVIDANRDPAGGHLYPGKNTTELVPLCSFDGEPIWLNNPSENDIAQRLADYHQPYHQALQAEIERVKAMYGMVVLYDCHSIRSQIPYLFDDTLPEINIGTNSGVSCSHSIESAIQQICAQSTDYRHVVNARFKGGWTTRHYGKPIDGVHAVQMELAQRSYLQSEHPPFDYDPVKATKLRAILRDILLEINNLIQ